MDDRLTESPNRVLVTAHLQEMAPCQGHCHQVYTNWQWLTESLLNPAAPPLSKKLPGASGLEKFSGGLCVGDDVIADSQAGLPQERKKSIGPYP